MYDSVGVPDGFIPGFKKGPDSPEKELCVRKPGSYTVSDNSIYQRWKYLAA